jgi:hypothetical protein
MQVKLFTTEGILTTILHDLIAAGFIFCVIIFNVKFLGNDVQAFDDSTMKKVLGKK